ncbi:glycoside hydrolase family 76 protein [Zasmidium cellare ATCC 36951]|uniref:Glycoside hydrolase family 76 protein n=1 Tax=Zasmidium cellare ATCC 36951 TaxID=1080233 RepID=A0A6A6D9C1_ZASCE|nr:glycoside hydrolase family 76 protein [Zasmidium cellare ATCC 36951]KAF2174246.1 glycoside hydrolase family 76 protein [Zasmidium cellare ATCC 36951]
MSRLWATGEVLFLFVAVLQVIVMLRQYAFTAVVLGASTATGTYWSGWHGRGNPWQWPGPYPSAGGWWLEQSQEVLSTLYSTYWNGTYWVEDPSILQWAAAVVNTFVIDTQRTFTTAISQYNGNSHGSQVNAAQIQANIRKYYSDIETFYTSGEDVNQIFDAAYDDAQWVVLEWLEAIKFVNQYDAYSKLSFGQEDVAEFAHRAHIFYNIVQNQFNTSLCEGGLTWNPALAPYKNAITNELFVSSSIGMYLYFPGDNNSDPYPSTTYSNRTLPPLPYLKPHDPLLLTNAKEEWAWFKSHNFTNAQGLVVDGFHISDGQTTCDERNEMVYTYNQGVMLSGLRELWEATGDTSYLQDGYGFINTVINSTGWNANGYGQAGQWAGLGRNGIMEDYCDAPANCSQDNLIFKGAYFEHLDLFCEPLPTETPLVKGLTYLADQGLANSHAQKCRSYAGWIQHNAYAALSTRNATSDIIGEWWGASYVSPQSLPLTPQNPRD